MSQGSSKVAAEEKLTGSKQHEHELWKAKSENVDNLSLSREFFRWIQTINDCIQDEASSQYPNKEIIRDLVGISSFIAAHNSIHDIYQEAKANY